MLGRNDGKLDDVHSRVHDVEEALPVFNSYVGSGNLTTTTATHDDDTTALFEQKSNKTSQVQPSNTRPDKFPTNLYRLVGKSLIGSVGRPVGRFYPPSTHLFFS